MVSTALYTGLSGLRLHQNEHTGGCSPKVLEALAGHLPNR